MDTLQWTRDLDEISAAVQKEFGSLTVQQLNWKPNEKSWSVGQVLDHLMVLNKTYYPVLESLHQGTYELPWIAKVGFMVRFFGNFLHSSLQPDRKRKTRTFPLWEPRQSDIPADIVQQFVLHQQEFKGKIMNSSDLLDRHAIISSPANRNLVYTLQRAFDILVVHEKRHLEQAREIMNMMPNR